MNNPPKFSAVEWVRWLAVVAAFGGAVALIVVQVSHDHRPNATGLGLVAIALVLMVGVVAPRASAQALARVSKLKVGGVEISLERERARAEAVTHKLPRRDEGVDVGPRPKSGDPAVDVLRVRDVARQRLRFMRSRLGRGPEYDYPDVLAWMHEHELLDTDETRVLLDLLYERVDRWPAAVRDPYLDAVWPFVSRLAAVVWDRHVQRRLRAAGWRLAPLPSSPDDRPDFIAAPRPNEPGYVTAARVGRPPRTLERSRKRLAGDLPPGAKGRLLVVPNPDDIPGDGCYDTVKVVTLKSLLPPDSA